MERDRHRETANLANGLGVSVRTVEPGQLEQEVGYPFHRGIIAYAERPVVTPDWGRWARIVVPWNLADEGNLGTLVRSAAALGADAIAVEKGRGADPFSPKAIRASSTAVFRIPVWECTGLAGELRRLRDGGIRIVGTMPGEDAIPLDRAPLPDTGVVLFGAEEDGLPDEIAALCDCRVRIPLANEVESLNVAASAAIVLHACWGEKPGGAP